DGRVGAEVGDAPTLGAQREPEADQPQVVELAGRACEQRQRSAALTPVACQAQEAAADDVRREVLLGYGRLPGAPALSEVDEVAEHDLLKQCLEGEGGQRAVEHAVRRRLVEAVERVG